MINEDNIPELCWAEPSPGYALVQRRIVCAANRYDDFIVLGARHYDPLMCATLDLLKKDMPGDKVLKGAYGDNQGFIDQFGKYHNRKDALTIATYAGQINTVRPKSGSEYELYSEDLY